MKVHWTDVAIATVVFAAGCVAIYAGLARALRRAVAERQLSTDRQLSALAMTVKALQLRVAELSGPPAKPMQAHDVDSGCVAGENMAGQVQPKTLAVITAAATTALGKKARVRSAQALPAAQEDAGAWAQQGRVIVQTSHNLRPRT